MYSNNKNFKVIKKEIKTSKANIICVKIPDNSTNLKIDPNSEIGTVLRYGDNRYDCQFFVDISKKNLKIIGFSHSLTENEIISIFKDGKEMYLIFNKNEILYNYSKFTGKWLVLAVSYEAIT